MSKRLIKGNSLDQSSPLSNANSRGIHTAQSNAGSQYGSIQGATQYIKARQDDYWNKIASYNRKIFELEKEEAKKKKQ